MRYNWKKEEYVVDSLDEDLLAMKIVYKSPAQGKNR